MALDGVGLVPSQYSGKAIFRRISDAAGRSSASAAAR
ncbi:Uncharacterised protein [Nocardia africana]|uniref:Uncharacterized protein n=1 Tax=Nocardia africana TaxID=134964 RepID=A0A378WVI9_9NOCA|nr:Uncharacterised protein [Nocardia africana]